MNTTSKVRKIAFAGDHLPRKCGIATFASDMQLAQDIPTSFKEPIANTE